MDFYKRLDAAKSNNRLKRLFADRPENLHDYQGCVNDPSMQSQADTPSATTEPIGDEPPVDPCPFCGSEPEETHSNDKDYFYVGCANEDCLVQPETGLCESGEGAHKAWNWKSATSSIPEERNGWVEITDKPKPTSFLSNDSGPIYETYQAQELNSYIDLIEQRNIHLRKCIDQAICLCIDDEYTKKNFRGSIEKLLRSVLSQGVAAPLTSADKGEKGR